MLSLSLIADLCKFVPCSLLAKQIIPWCSQELGSHCLKIVVVNSLLDIYVNINITMAGIIAYGNLFHPIIPFSPEYLPTIASCGADFIDSCPVLLKLWLQLGVKYILIFCNYISPCLLPKDCLDLKTIFVWGDCCKMINECFTFTFKRFAS